MQHANKGGDLPPERENQTQLNRNILTAALQTLEAKRDQIFADINQINALLGVRTPGASRRGRRPKAVKAAASPTRKISAAGRAKIAAAQKARWAAYHKAQKGAK